MNHRCNPSDPQGSISSQSNETGKPLSKSALKRERQKRRKGVIPSTSATSSEDSQEDDLCLGMTCVLGTRPFEMSPRDRRTDPICWTRAIKRSPIIFLIAMLLTTTWLSKIKRVLSLPRNASWGSRKILFRPRLQSELLGAQAYPRLQPCCSVVVNPLRRLSRCLRGYSDHME